MLFALGFVFMFTIGGLHKNLIALPYNLFLDFTTICWELLTIMLLEYYLISVTKYNFEGSAGNQKIFSNILVGSSETTRRCSMCEHLCFTIPLARLSIKS